MKTSTGTLLLIGSGLFFVIAGYDRFWERPTPEANVPPAPEIKDSPPPPVSPTRPEPLQEAPTPSRLVAPLPAAEPVDQFELNHAYRLGVISAGVDKEYGGLFSELQKRGRPFDRLRQLLIERLMISQDFFEMAYPEGIRGTDENAKATSQLVARMLKKQAMDFEQEFRAHLGESDFKTWREYEGKKPERHLADELDFRVGPPSEQLTPEQRKRFIEVMWRLKNENGYRNSSDSVTAALRPRILPHESMRIVPYAALEAMSPLLTPTQLQHLRHIYDDQHR